AATSSGSSGPSGTTIPTTSSAPPFRCQAVWTMTGIFNPRAFEARAANACASPSGARAPHDRAEVTSKESRRSLRILLVDDDPALRHMIVDYLDVHDMRAVPAPVPYEMNSHLAQSEPDLVILDLDLGRNNGLDLLRE